MTDNIKSYINSSLTQKRQIHCNNVAEEAASLAKTFGADIQKAYFCGLVHDIAKEMPFENQYSFVKNSKMNVSQEELDSRALWHAISGAALLSFEFGIFDDDILNAVRYHTVARAGMSRLEEIIYLADLVSADRTYKDVKRMRKICRNNLEEGMLEALKFQIADCISKGSLIPVSSIEAYNYYDRMRNQQ